MSRGIGKDDIRELLFEALGGTARIEAIPVTETNVPLGAGASWTSPIFEVMTFDKIIVTMTASHQANIEVFQGTLTEIEARSVEAYDPAVNPNEAFLVDVAASHAYVVFTNTSGVVMANTQVRVRRKR